MIQDTKAMIDFVREYTNSSKVGIIAHSQGGSQVLAGMSQEPQWFKQRVAIMVVKEWYPPPTPEEERHYSKTITNLVKGAPPLRVKF
jgi:hypothetical protein